MPYSKLMKPVALPHQIIFYFPAATGEAPEIDLARIYGVTAFELE
jgi:hypothetical protein